MIARIATAIPTMLARRVILNVIASRLKQKNWMAKTTSREMADAWEWGNKQIN